MKSFLILLFLSFSCLSSYSQVDSLWIGKIHEPCNEGPLENDTCYNSSGWIGPKTDTIPGIYSDPSCDASCVFIIVYYEVFDTLAYDCYNEKEKAALDSNERLEANIFISGMYWDGGIDCYLCDKTKMREYFTKKYYTDLEVREPGILNRLTVKAVVNGQGDTVRAYDPSTSIAIGTVGVCIDSSGIECDPEIKRCCQSYSNIYSSIEDIENRTIDSVSSFLGQNLVYPDSCISPCTPECEPITRSKNSALAGCDFPCNDGTWTSDSSGTINIDSLLNGCTGFSIKIYYSSRSSTSPPCPENYKDIRFDSIAYFGPDSCILQIQNSAIITYVNIWLLTKSALGFIPIDRCKTEFRLVNAVCVTDFDTLTNTGLGPCNPLYNDQLGCCWGQYVICRTGFDSYTYTKLDGTEFIGDTCTWFTRPCIAVCDEVIQSLSQNPNDLYGPNSFERFYSAMEGMKKGESYVITSTNVAKSIKSKILPNNEAIIYDIMGNALGQRKALDYMYDDLDRGVYFILEKNEDEVLRIIKVYIEK